MVAGNLGAAAWRNAIYMSPHGPLNQEIKRIRAEARIGKKKHFNAADRKDRVHTNLGWPVVLINVLLGSLLFTLLTRDGSQTADCFKWAGALLAFLGAALAALQTYFDYATVAAGHRSVAQAYLSLMRECRRVLATLAVAPEAADDLAEMVSSLSRRYDEITEQAQGYPTSAKDYQRARQGEASGEEDFSETELERGN